MGISAATIAEIGSIASVAGTGLSVIGAIKGAQGAKAEGKANANASRYAAQVAENNATISKQNASLAAQQGTAAVEKEQLENRAKIGAITANQGASGVNLNSGSSVDVRSSAAETGELSAINIRAAAARQAYGFQQEASNQESQAGLDKAEASNAITAGNTKATTTLLGGLGDAATNYSNYLNKASPLSTDSDSSGFATDYQIQDMNGIGAF